MVEGEEYADRPDVSMIEGTPEIQNRIALENAMGTLALDETRQKGELAKLPAGDRLQIEDEEIRRAVWVLRAIKPRITAIEQRAAAEIKEIMATVPDQREQQRQISVIEDAARAEIDALNSVIATISRQRLPQT
jgi:hypothetical protein